MEILFNLIDGVKEICYICGEVIHMAKPNIGKLKEMARDLKDDKKSGGVKKLGDKLKESETKKKPITDGKVSGRKA